MRKKSSILIWLRKFLWRISYLQEMGLRLSQKGKMIWQKTYGGKEVEKGISIHETKNNEIMLIGETSSFGKGEKDIWIVKIDSSGQERWNKTIGKKRDEFVAATHQHLMDLILFQGLLIRLEVYFQGNKNIIMQLYIKLIMKGIKSG